MTTDDYASTWDKIRSGVARELLTDKEPLESTQAIEMILGTLTVVDSQNAGKQSPEVRKSNSDMICAVLSRENELLDMPLSKTSMLFACISRYIAMMDEGQDEPTEATQRFEQYKEKYANSVAISGELKIDDVFVLSMALAAEQVKSPVMWDAFARLAVEKEYEVDEKEYFKSFSNLAWAMTKVDYSGSDFWGFIERLFAQEIERTKLPQQPVDL